MSGRVPLSSKSRASDKYGNGDVAAAKRRFRRFTGHEAEVLGELDVPPMPKVAAVIGEITALCYVTTRDGKVEHYKHEFSQSAAPLFCVGPDGKQILIVGNRFKFTERGIVDKPSRKR